MNKSLVGMHMDEFGKISWDEDTKKERHKEVNQILSDFIDGWCKSHKEAKEQLNEKRAIFIKEIENLDNAFREAQKVFAKIPFSASFLAIVMTMAEGRADYVEEAKMLLENGFIGYQDNNGNIWTLEHVAKQDANIVYQAIRCHREWPIKVRERLVRRYKSILYDLNNVTMGYIGKKTDNEIFYHNRFITYDFFINFLGELNEKAQLVAKLLYYGRKRSLDDVLKLEIKDINFTSEVVKYSNQDVSYPKHVFCDLSAIIQDRKSGRVFLGRQNSPLNPATIFRNFKEAGQKLGMPSFSPSMLVHDN